MPTSTFDAQSPAVQKVISDLLSPWKFSLFKLLKLPTLTHWRVRIKSLTPQRAEVTLPYGWRTQNPFRSIYFAAQCGAAELSTGTLAIIAIEGRGPISMLITHVEAEFVKKANALVTFTCEEGEKIQEAVQRAIDTGAGQQVRVTSVGTQKGGEVVSRIHYTWSFKVKS